MQERESLSLFDVKLEPLAKFHQTLRHFVHQVKGEIGPHHFCVEAFVVLVVLK